jgi:TonB family protein
MIRRPRSSSHLAICAVLLAATGAGAATSTVGGATAADGGPALSGAMPQDVFHPPSRRDMKEPVYPRGRQTQGREGWVQLNFMIDPQGKPYEVAVTDSTGDEQFERSAVRAVERSTFAPASLNGQPIDAAYNLKIKFSLVDGRSGARPEFVADYQVLTNAIESDDRDGATQALAEVEVQNLYEDAFYNLARYNYYARWGEPRAQREALAAAVAHEQEEGYLPVDVFVWALRSLLSLQVQAQDYGGALDTWRTLAQQTLEPDVRARLERAVAEIRALRDDDRAYAVQGALGDETSWFFRLLKDRFQVDQVQGDVAQIKLRCERKYVLFQHQEDVIYTISDSYGDCRMEVVGKRGTTFRLIQS